MRPTAVLARRSVVYVCVASGVLVNHVLAAEANPWGRRTALRPSHLPRPGTQDPRPRAALQQQRRLRGLAPGHSSRPRPAAPPVPSPALGGPGAVLVRGAGREACPRESGGATAAAGPSPCSASAAAAPGKALLPPPLSGTCVGWRGPRREFPAEGCRGGRGAAAAVPHPLLCRLESRCRPLAAGGPFLAARAPQPGRPHSLDPAWRAPGPVPPAPGSRSLPLALGRRSASPRRLRSRSGARLGCSRLFGNSLSHK